jgi:hypothetical protein
MGKVILHTKWKWQQETAQFREPIHILRSYRLEAFIKQALLRRASLRHKAGQDDQPQTAPE